jgi:hypothetical protein
LGSNLGLDFDFNLKGFVGFVRSFCSKV